MEFALDAALAVLQQLNAQLDEDAQISLTDLFIKASASATKAVPAVNAAWLEGGIVRSYSRFDLNFVVGVDAGLVAPAIIGVDSLGLKDVADRTKAAIVAVNSDSAPPEAYACGTFTLVGLLPARSLCLFSHPAGQPWCFWRLFSRTNCRNPTSLRPRPRHCGKQTNPHRRRRQTLRSPENSCCDSLC